MSTTTIAGNWESMGNEIRPNPWGGNYFLRRYFHNTETEAHGTLVFYTDETHTARNITVEVIGPYRFLQPSAHVEGAIETDFEFTTIAVTPHSQAMVDLLNSAPADYLKTWEPNVRQQVSKTGQGIMGMVIGVYKEYDLTKVDGNLLYYGARPSDGSAPDTAAKRAISLQVPLQKVTAFTAPLY